MRQVPHYLIIGNGRLARHFQHYFNLLSLPYSTWHRGESPEVLQQKVAGASHILILISDAAIEGFIQTHLASANSMLIHFSGSLATDLAIGAHPLFGFHSGTYSLLTYQSIPFVIDHDAPDFESLLPGLHNAHSRLHKNQKAKYHALCVMSGNFSCLLWQKYFKTLEDEFHLPVSIAYPYLQQQTQNLIQDATHALTGPLVRDDQITIQKNIDALSGDPFKALYEAFVTCYQALQEEQLK